MTSEQSFTLLSKRNKEVAEENEMKEEKRKVALKKKTEKTETANALASLIMKELGEHPWNNNAVGKLTVPKIKALISFRGKAPLKNGKKDTLLAQMAELYGHSLAPAPVVQAQQVAPPALTIPPHPPLEIHVDGGAAAAAAPAVTQTTALV